MTTDWHMLLIVASLKPETATGCLVGLPLRSVPSARLPYCTKSWPTNWSAETLKLCPDTLNDAASAPCARATPIAAVAATLGTMTTAKRFHLVPPRAWDSITFLLLGRTSPDRASARPGMGEVLRPREGERLCVSRGTSRVRITDDHPRATTTGPRASRGRRTGPAGRREPPVPWVGATAPPARPVGTDRGGGTAGSPYRCAVGPSVDDRGVFTPGTQGGSLLASNE